MKSKELLALQEVWRMAFAKGGPLDIPFKTAKAAIRGRMQLYAAVRRQKRGEDMSDLTLVKAAEELEIVWVGEATLRLQKRADNDTMQAFQAVLGKSINDFMDPELEEATERMLRSLEGIAPEPPAEDLGLSGHQENPFYGKRG